MVVRSLSLRAYGSLALAALAAAGCKTQGAQPRVPLEVPNAVSGGTRGGGRPDSPSAERMAESNALAQADRDAKAEQAKVDKAASLEARWQNAVARSESKPGSAADDFKKVADEDPGGIHAEEARYLSAVSYMAAYDWSEAVAALTRYMSDFPVNPHLHDVERMLYEASTNVIAGAKGFKGIFKSDKTGFDGLQTVVDKFPEGEYADDALMTLGDEYGLKADDANAALSYREILLKYPQSPIAPQARLKLADTYLRRDQGDQYHAGFVDVDPRGPRTPQYAATRPVVSCVETARLTYEQFLREDRARACPEELSYAQQKVDECRARLAAKDRTIAAYYARLGDQSGAAAYGQMAEDALAGRTCAQGYVSPPASPPAADNPPPAAGTPSTPRPPSPPPPTPPPSTATPRTTVTPSTGGEPVPSASIPPPPLPPAPRPQPPAPPPYVPPPYVPPPPQYVPPPPAPPVPPPTPPPTPPPGFAPAMPTFVPPGALPPPRHIETTLSPGAPR